jgi:UDP-glucose 4-epimerase
MGRNRYLVTGGAGFVGSHLVQTLLEQDADVLVLDNLSTGHLAAIPPGARFLQMDLADHATLEAAVADGPWHAVFHFAALSLVGESMRDPCRYLAENVGNGIALIQACIRHGVPRFVLSSTAAIFAPTDRPTIDESAPIDPPSAYGDSKRMIERALLWAGQVHNLRSACLRYFNAAGADPRGRLGEDHRPETHLIPLAIDAALGRIPPLTVFGDDYPTPDGTCIRDYIHVTDLADAHIRVLAKLDTGSAAYNLGNGNGYSVLDVLKTVEQVGGKPVPHALGARRAGDPPRLVAASTRMREDCGWTPRYAELETIVRTAWAWRERNPKGYRT